MCSSEQIGLKILLIQPSPKPDGKEPWWAAREEGGVGEHHEEQKGGEENISQRGITS